jgi:23S rRNA (uridine2552-2'-O)-methyltransferase
MAQARKLHDRFFKQAKEEGYAARSAYKLIQIDDKKRVFKRGDWVLDLGCAPGSWVQVAAEQVGPKGRVGGIDLKPVAIELPHNARSMVADIFQTEPAELLRLIDDSPTPRRCDVLLSDMAPSTEGGAGGSIDHLRSIQLCRRVLALATDVLRDRGTLVMKVFEGEAYPALLAECNAVFGDVKGFKPESSRDVSREMFIIAKGFKSQKAATPVAPPPGIAKAPPAPRPGWNVSTSEPVRKSEGSRR